MKDKAQPNLQQRKPPASGAALQAASSSGVQASMDGTRVSLSRTSDVQNSVDLVPLIQMVGWW